MKVEEGKNFALWRSRLHEIIFETDTKEGKLFDLILILSIIISVGAVIIESVNGIRINYGTTLRNIEWIFTILFTIEFFLRVISVKKPLKYIFSFFGIVDFMSTLPTYLAFFITGAHILVVIRVLRLLRLFRVLKLIRYVDEANILMTALKSSKHKIVVFLFAVLSIIVIVGSLIYIIEGPENGFNDIPKSMYWAVVTITTVGYGDITPQTVVGRVLSSILMIVGYGILAIPTGIFSVELSRAYKKTVSNQACPFCSLEGHDGDAKFCKFCGEKL